MHPTLSNNIAPMRSTGFQTPFYFGGSQTPFNLSLTSSDYNGSHETFPEHKQVDATKLMLLLKKRRNPAKIIPGL